jgi:hypothetical protein
MDIVLEGLDKYMFDHVFAALFPLPGPSAANATFSSVREAPTAAATSSFEFKPASEYFHFEPTETAYMTTVHRDNVWRQLAELFFIVWYVYSHRILPPLEGLRADIANPGSLDCLSTTCSRRSRISSSSTSPLSTTRNI